MLSAVSTTRFETPGAQRFAAQFPGIGARDAGAARSVRQRVEPPNGQVPSGTNPLPTSSARPNRGSNQKIVYTRVTEHMSSMHAANTGASLAPDTVAEGDIVFVHNCEGLGRGTDRLSRVASIAQINAMLSDHRPSQRGRTTSKTLLRRRRDFPNITFLAPWAKTFEKNEENDGCSLLAEWRPDGVVATNERSHGILDRNTHPLVGSETSGLTPGEAFNVCVGGVTAVNLKAGKPIACLDNILLKLIATKKTASDDDFFYAYHYEIETCCDDGPAKETAGRSVAAYFVLGKIVDTNAANNRVTLNVAIREGEKWAKGSKGVDYDKVLEAEKRF